MRETSHLQIITFGLQHTAGPYRCANKRLMHRSKQQLYSITSSARSTSELGIITPIMRAVLRLVTSPSS